MLYLFALIQTLAAIVGLTSVLRFPNRSRPRRRSRPRPLCISKGWSLRLRSSFDGRATPCDAGRAGVHLPSEPVHDMTIGPADADQAGAHAGRWVHVILSTILRLLPVRFFFSRAELHLIC